MTVFSNLGTMEIKKQEWVWKRWIPKGAITLVDGDPGDGKSTVITDLAARVSRDGEMPDGSIGASGNVIFVTSEDDPQTTISPRVKAAGGDTSKIIFSNDFMLPRGLKDLVSHVSQNPISLLVIDPLSGHVSSATSSEQKMRSVLTGLSQVASAHNFGVVLVRHHGKTLGRRSITSGLGSTAIAAVARSMMMLKRSPNRPDERILSLSKSSLGVTATSLSFNLQDLDGVGVVRWLGESEFTSEDLLRPKASKQTALEEAIGFIEQELREGPRRREEIFEEAARRGISRMTLRRASEELQVVSAPREFQGPYFWMLQSETKEQASDEESPSVVHPEMSDTAEFENMFPCPTIVDEQLPDVAVVTEIGMPDSLAARDPVMNGSTI
jgi:KaiC/GvpD/RAD55 family RecA-like ATPase